MPGKFYLFILLVGFSTNLSAEDDRGGSIDIHSIRLKLDLTDSNSQILYGQASLSISAKMNGVKTIDLDLLQLHVDSVKLNTRNIPFPYNDSVLHIEFPSVLNKGDSSSLEIFYHGHPLQIPRDFGGFYWTDDYIFNIGVSFLSEPHSFGKTWFPCFDNFKVRSYFEYFITTRAGQKAFCNGTLLDSIANDSTVTWHWKLQENIPSYLASVAVSDYQTLSDTLHGMNGIIPIEIAARTADTALVNKSFIHLHQAFHIFEKLWGPYRWERVGYCIIPFTAGAMEHATNIGFMRRYLTVYAGECEATLVHELSHHWFGNLVTCNSEGDMWLNEGWATYCSTLFMENYYGKDIARQYQRENHLTDLSLAHVHDGGYLALSGVPPNETYGTTVYYKGSDVVHTLRGYMGDSAFFHCVRAYLDHYAFASATSLQLRDYLSECSGIDLKDFFNDWVFSPGYPHFSINDVNIKQAKRVYSVNVAIRQRLNHAPHPYNNVPVNISYFDKDFTRIVVRVITSGEYMMHQERLSFKPVFIALDFDEELQDARTADWEIVSDTGTFNFESAFMNIRVNAVHRPSLIRVEHNWVAADAMRSPIPGLHLNKNHYWTVDGIFEPGLNFSGTIEYNGSENAPLDSGFITNLEDSLVIMYRPNGASDWIIASSFFVNPWGSDSDKIGAITINNLKRGDYAMAIYDSRFRAEADTDFLFPLLPTTVFEFNIKDGKSRVIKYNFDLITHNRKSIVIYFDKDVFTKAEVSTLSEGLLVAQKIADDDKSVLFKTKKFQNESYVVTLTTKSGERITKKVIKN